MANAAVQKKRWPLLAGDDVAALQEFMGEQGYLNCVDGVTGYFGSVTKEAVQNWQRDQGLPVTGVFDSECKWAYLRQQVCVGPGVGGRHVIIM